MPKVAMTLAAIRKQRPCVEGWSKLLASLGGATVPLDTVVSLGDVARSNGQEDALWCARCLDWSDIAVRRAVLGAILPAMRRAHRGAMPSYLAGLIRWQGGDDSVDLPAARMSAGTVARVAAREAFAAAETASAAAVEVEAAWAVSAAAAGSMEAAWAAVGSMGAAWAAARAQRSMAAWAAARATPAAREAAWAAARAEQELQRADIIASFPPLHQQKEADNAR